MSDYRQPVQAMDEMVGRVARAIGFGWDGSDVDYMDYLPVAGQIIELLKPDFAAAREAGRRERDAEVAGLRDALQECADDLEAYVDHQYDKPSREYPVIARRYEQDMTTVRAARAALAALAAAPGPGGDAKE